MGLFKKITEALDDFTEAAELLDEAIEEEKHKANAYLHQFHAELIQDTDVQVVRTKMESERLDAQNTDLLDAWRGVSSRCAKMAAIRLRELETEAEKTRQRGVQEAARKRKEEADLARRQREANETESRRLAAERAALQAERARMEAERRPPTAFPAATHTPAPSTSPAALAAGPVVRADRSARSPQPPQPPVRTAPPASREVRPAVETAQKVVPAATTSRSEPAIALTGHDLKRWRENAQLSQRQAAARLGVSHGTIGKAEALPNGPLPPGLQEALSKHLLP